MNRYIQKPGWEVRAAPWYPDILFKGEPPISRIEGDPNSFCEQCNQRISEHALLRTSWGLKLIHPGDMLIKSGYGWGSLDSNMFYAQYESKDRANDAR